MTSLTGSTARPRLGWLAVGAFAGLALTVAFGPALAMRPARAVDPTTTTPEHTISVSGIGRVTTTPDVADVRVGVQVTRTKVRDAQAAARIRAATDPSPEGGTRTRTASVTGSPTISAFRRSLVAVEASS